MRFSERFANIVLRTWTSRQCAFNQYVLFIFRVGRSKTDRWSKSIKIRCRDRKECRNTARRVHGIRLRFKTWPIGFFFFCFCFAWHRIKVNWLVFEIDVVKFKCLCRVVQMVFFKRPFPIEPHRDTTEFPSLECYACVVRSVSRFRLVRRNRSRFSLSMFIAAQDHIYRHNRIYRHKNARWKLGFCLYKERLPFLGHPSIRCLARRRPIVYCATRRFSF